MMREADLKRFFWAINTIHRAYPDYDIELQKKPVARKPRSKQRRMVWTQLDTWRTIAEIKRATGLTDVQISNVLNSVEWRNDIEVKRAGKVKQYRRRESKCVTSD